MRTCRATDGGAAEALPVMRAHPGPASCIIGADRSAPMKLREPGMPQCDLIFLTRKYNRFSLAALCGALLEYLIVKVADSLAPWEARQTPAFDTYQRCRRHIVAHFDRLKSLDQVAQECHVDRAYLCRLFRRYDRQTPYRFLLRQKMSLAAERLQDPGVLVKQVAAELGFDDPFHFSRAFKNTFGVSPEAFRRLR